MNCFFITPIGEEGSKTREAADDVFHGLVKPVCEKIGYNPIRADQLTSTAFIAQEIFEHLNNDEMVIADVTDHNPNVYLELGYRIRSILRGYGVSTTDSEFLLWKNSRGSLKLSSNQMQLILKTLDWAWMMYSLSEENRTAQSALILGSYSQLQIRECADCLMQFAFFFYGLSNA